MKDSLLNVIVNLLLNDIYCFLKRFKQICSHTHTHVSVCVGGIWHVQVSSETGTMLDFLKQKLQTGYQMPGVVLEIELGFSARTLSALHF